MSASVNHAEIVTSLYNAFGTGDIAFILEHLADDVSWDADWESNSAQLAGAPHMAARRGPAQVAEFFALLSEWKFEDFTVLDVIGSDGQVVTEMRVDIVMPNGGRIADQELHLWSFDDQHRVRTFRTYADTAKNIAANSGVDTTVPGWTFAS
ncbi:nuclear transport factor 2 family protein [Nocardia sp. NPDC058058]|uniref:nuclear transport factor 2 family protein n=1 Tax=Nocardia sp. NPDC058058 TaxID=3346317 RepID=UPI0036DCF1D6